VIACFYINLTNLAALLAIQAESESFNSFTKVMARCNIEPAIAPNGDKIYPDLNSFKDGGAVLLPGAYKVRFVEREESINLL
jgi:hypothetical protein